VDYAGAAPAAVLVTRPPYTYDTGREIAPHARVIDRAANTPVRLYDDPGRMRVNRRVDGLDRWPST